MNPATPLVAHWREKNAEVRVFDEDFQVILRRNSRKKPNTTKKKMWLEAEEAALMVGLSNPLLYRRGGNLAASLLRLVQTLERARQLACIDDMASIDTDSLNKAKREAADLWRESVLPLVWMNRDNVIKCGTLVLKEDEKLATLAVDNRLLALARAKERCLDYGAFYYSQRLDPI